MFSSREHAVGRVSCGNRVAGNGYIVPGRQFFLYDVRIDVERISSAIGGGGLGQIAISYGYNRYQTDVLLVTVILLIILMQAIQLVGMYISRKTDKRVRE